MYNIFIHFHFSPVLSFRSVERRRKKKKSHLTRQWLSGWVATIDAKQRKKRVSTIIFCSNDSALLWDISFISFCWTYVSERACVCVCGCLARYTLKRCHILTCSILPFDLFHASVPKTLFSTRWRRDNSYRIYYARRNVGQTHSLCPFKVAKKRNKKECDTRIHIFIVWMVITTIIVSGTIYQPIKPTEKYEHLLVAFELSRFIVVFILAVDKYSNRHTLHLMDGHVRWIQLLG